MIAIPLEYSTYTGNELLAYLSDHGGKNLFISTYGRYYLLRKARWSVGLRFACLSCFNGFFVDELKMGVEKRT